MLTPEQEAELREAERIAAEVEEELKADRRMVEAAAATRKKQVEIANAQLRGEM